MKRSSDEKGACLPLLCIPRFLAGVIAGLVNTRICYCMLLYIATPRL